MPTTNKRRTSPDGHEELELIFRLAVVAVDVETPVRQRGVVDVLAGASTGKHNGVLSGSSASSSLENLSRSSTSGQIEPPLKT